jgi:hypothetical protein
MDTQPHRPGGTFIRIKILQLPVRVRDTYMLIMIFIEYKKKKAWMITSTIAPVIIIYL